jgi:hypothetical protein
VKDTAKWVSRTDLYVHAAERLVLDGLHGRNGRPSLQPSS